MTTYIEYNTIQKVIASFYKDSLTEKPENVNCHSRTENRKYCNITKSIEITAIMKTIKQGTKIY